MGVGAGVCGCVCVCVWVGGCAAHMMRFTSSAVGLNTSGKNLTALKDVIKMPAPANGKANRYVNVDTFDFVLI